MDFNTNHRITYCFQAGNTLAYLVAVSMSIKFIITLAIALFMKRILAKLKLACKARAHLNGTYKTRQRMFASRKHSSLLYY